MTASGTSWLHPAFVAFALGTLVALWVWRRYSLRRALQVFSMNAFVALFWLAAFDGRPRWPVDLFLFTDPLVALVHTLAGRAVVGLLLVSLAFVVLAAVMGRVFCSHVCPLGTLLDVTDVWLGRTQRAKENRSAYRRARKTKFVFLLVTLVAAVGGFNLLAFGDPIVIFTRFASTLLHPLILLLEDVGLLALRPVGEWLDWFGLAYLELPLRTFEGALGMAGLLAAVLLLSRLQPRFWCRHLCPLGGLLAWLGKWAPYRRRVSDACEACHECASRCPMGAIDQESAQSDRSECIVCLSCVRACPKGATSFGFSGSEPSAELPGARLGRRAFVGGAVGGVAAGLAMRADLLHPAGAGRPLPFRHQGLLRPPGALPEAEFLSRCLRCGQCMGACPTNTLQPDWYRAGLEGLWAPHLGLRHAACQQDCNVCGQICPSQSIRPLELVEKRHARVGTAVVLRERCLPWSQDEACLICEEQCPYGAVSLQRDGRHPVAVPFVDPSRCNGCGLCEDRCPVVGEGAIVVTPQGELRLSEGSYVAEARSQGLVFEANQERKEGLYFEGDGLFRGLH